MSARVKVTVKDGVMPAREYVFGNRTVCTVGRGQDCDVQMPADFLHQSISPHHCVLDIDPPNVRVRDLGSRNGTFLNGKKIGQRRQHGLTTERAEAPDLTECPVNPGDMIQLGESVLEVTVCPSDTPTKTDDP
jgi:pSer/pThr/pTyr-binding forkhead associated (FHA) protein